MNTTKYMIVSALLTLCTLLSSCGKDGQTSNNPSSLIIGDWLCVKLEKSSNNGEITTDYSPSLQLSFTSTIVKFVSNHEFQYQYTLDSSTKGLYFAGCLFGTINKLTHEELVIDTKGGYYNVAGEADDAILYFKKK